MTRQLFQSTPVITDGRTTQLRRPAGVPEVFQSTPVITDGRTSRAFFGGALNNRFNPRPSSLTGEPAAFTEETGIEIVSIHARHH